MSGDSPKRDYETARDRLDERHENGVVPPEDYERIIKFLNAYDPSNQLVSTPAGEESKEYSTLKSYCSRYTWVSDRMQDANLVTATTEDINQHMQELLDGDNPDIKDDGFSKNTVALYQSALRSFYRYYDDLDVEPEGIALTQPDDSPVDEQSLLDQEDIKAIREVVEHPRDRCLIELLLHTGQRVRAIQTLRLKDVNVEEGRFRLNPDADGLKHAEGWRPLLGARGYVKQWLDYHPTNDPDDYLITPIHNNNPDSVPGKMLSRAQIRRRLIVLADKAEVDKPVNPHQWRHVAVTKMYRDHDLDLDKIRWLIGHGEDSRILETTYRHLTDEDRIEKVEFQAGFRDDDGSDSTFTPDACPICNTSLPDTANLCPQCGETLTPSAAETENKIEESLYEGKGEAQDDDEEAAVDALRELVKDNPQRVIELLNEDD